MTWDALLAQLPPGLDEAITAAIAAASTRGWEAIVLVVIVLGGFAFFGYMFRHFADQAKVREERLSARVTHLEDLIRDKLFNTLDQTSTFVAQMVSATNLITAACEEITVTLARFETTLQNRPCMAMDAAERAKLVDALVERLPASIALPARHEKQ